MLLLVVMVMRWALSLPVMLLRQRLLVRRLVVGLVVLVVALVVALVVIQGSSARWACSATASWQWPWRCCVPPRLTLCTSTSQTSQPPPTPSTPCCSSASSWMPTGGRRRTHSSSMSLPGAVRAQEPPMATAARALTILL